MGGGEVKGHEAVIAMRCRGVRPVSVFLDADGGLPLRLLRSWPESSPARASVQLGPADDPRRIDLRFVIGLRVHVLGQGRRVAAVVDAVISAGAAEVVAVLNDEVFHWRRADHAMAA
jgi:hypothetical protein